MTCWQYEHECMLCDAVYIEVDRFLYAHRGENGVRELDGFDCGRHPHGAACDSARAVRLTQRANK